MHPYKKQAERSQTDKVKGYGGQGSGSMGHMKGEMKGMGQITDAEMKAMKGRKGYNSGGIVEGDTSGPRMDRPASKGKKGGATTVNVIIADKDGQQQPGAPAPVPGAQPPERVPVPVPMPAPPPGAGAPMPGGPPPGAGMPPPMMRRGGRAGYRKGGTVKMDAGAGSGEGRLEKEKKYR